MPKPDWFDLLKARWKTATQAEERQRQCELDDLAFEAGEHWDAKVKKDREDAGKPCLTIDLLSGPIKQVTNSQRNSRPGIQISPVGQGADGKKAEYWQGIVRRIERLSQAGRAYSWAGQHQVKMGRGFWLVRNLRVGNGFDQDIRIVEVDNQHTWYCDPTCKKLDGSDKKWAIGFEDLTHEDYTARFGESALADAMEGGGLTGGVGDDPPDWITDKHIRIAEYFYLETESRTKHLLSDGSEVFDDELQKTAGRIKGKFAQVPQLPDGVTITQTRKVDRNRVRWCLTNGRGEKLEQTTIPGEYIPVVRIFGERRNINGQVDYRGLVRMAKDPSRMEDFCESSFMEAVSIAKTAPWVAEWDQIAEFNAIWQNANKNTVAVLPYKRVSSQNGAPLPPPQRVVASVDVGALTMAAQRMQNHVRNVTGNADVFQEETKQEQSGRAILARKQFQEIGTSDYLDNMGDGIVLTAKIIMSMAREVYDTPRVLRIVGADEKERAIVTHLGPEQAQQAQELAGQEIKELFDLSGDPDDFDIAISPGKNYQTARQESVEMIGDAIKAYPPIAQIALPILFRNSDFEGAQEIAAKLEPNQDQQIPPQVQQHMQQMSQQLQQAMEYIKTEQAKQQATLEGKRIDAQLKLQLQQMQDATTLAVAKINVMAKGVIAQGEAEDEAIALQQAQHHEAAMAAADASHEENMARTAHEHTMEQAREGAVGQMAVNANKPQPTNGAAAE